MAKKEDVDRLIAEMRTVDAKIEVVAQRIRTIEKNEEVLGRTLLALSQKLRKFESEGGGGGGRGLPAEELEKKFTTKSEFAELKYVLDSVNPLEYATISQVRELIDEKLAKLGSPAQSAGQGEAKERPRRSGNFMERI